MDTIVKLCHAWTLPRVVDADVSDGGKGKKGKSKSTGDRGKGKGKGKDKNKHKGNDGDKNKERDDWNNGQRQAKFQGYCSHCSKWGPNVRIGKLDWFNRIMVQWLAYKNLNLKLRMSKQHNGVTSTVKTWTCTRRVVCCFAALNNSTRPASTLLVDSGADDHICHPDFAKDFPLKSTSDTERRASHHGTQHTASER